MINKPTKSVLLGNIQLLDYCKRQHIDLDKLQMCNVERMGNKFFFVLSIGAKSPTLENDIESQPDVVLTMDVSKSCFQFDRTEWTRRVVKL